ncbi:3-hydroxyacyl-CoA dehydrogenase [Actinobacteria bacterium YIM 96077]|uniref:3-hydroxyacyl-CoA dehydrogenase n=1 Tax=Phytoactinopolyspora halophila TaxID=1981511 RepID=A0A329R1I9_9ACTN|nr:3-hydroxyacyl-CoA dehydrogenase NAD-binding domain-containing protein [Phytoactinopolyspora halophila]AYY13413.1 3-hydroxyacyl-CoA dehydrogenase [Actinobacteria bacterium YIM 96077]RAW17352.1 3-hydroxyacyl-CoA dehydrogenase [Phytoactinopolyspora halophila]
MTTSDISHPEEVVTHAYLRFVELPADAGTAALITLDNGHDHTKPNTLGPAGLRSLERAIDAAYAQPGIVAVAVTGKPFVLAAGADLKAMGMLTDREQALEVARLGHRVLGKLGDGPVPTFGLINGAALGGGLEIALNCTYRTVSKAASSVALPEVFLGLVPGWGGAWLLPNIAGPDTAVKVIVENALNQNRMLAGAQVAELGIADVALDAADFIEQSLTWAARVLRGDVTVERQQPNRDEDAWEQAVARGRAFADSKVHGAAPAPYTALELISAARTTSRDEGFAAEDEALADLIMTEELRAGLYAFDLTQRRAKRPAGAPDKELARPITKVGVVGAGLMASQLALLFARRLEVPVIMTDLDDERVSRGVGYVHGELDTMLGKGRISPDQANRYKALVSGSTDNSVFADADFVIEAVFEEMGVKQQVFTELESIVSEECILATNTSSLSVSEMASVLKAPGRLVGFHFFNPVAVLPLLEIVRAEHTDDAALATAFATAKTLKKSPVLVKDAPAFVVNRILLRVMAEVLRAVDDGTPLQVADNALLKLGLPMSPFVLLQLVGPAVGLHVLESLHAAFPERYPVSPNLRRLVEAGKPGVWSWDEHGKPYLEDDTAALIEQGDQELTAEQVRERVLDAVAQEIRLMLDDGVVAEPQDIDLCMILGAGWPFHLGGVTPYLDRSGVAEKVTGRRFLPAGVASLPAS